MMKFSGVFCVFMVMVITTKAQVNDKPEPLPFQNLLTKELSRMAKNVRKQLHSEMTELVQEIRLKFLDITTDFEAMSENTSVEVRENMFEEKQRLEDRFMKVVNYSSNRMEGLTNYLEYLDLAVKGHVDPYDLQDLLISDDSDAPIQNRKEREPGNPDSTDHYSLYGTDKSSSNVDKSPSFMSTQSSIDLSTPGKRMPTTQWKAVPITLRKTQPTNIRKLSKMNANNMNTEANYNTSPFLLYSIEGSPSSLDNDLSESTTRDNIDTTTFASAGAVRPDDLSMIFDNSKPDKPRSCDDLFHSGNTQDGIYVIYPEGPGGMGLAVQCVMTQDEGGWTVILARLPDVEHVEFSRPVHDYVIGFGKPQGHYWMGLRHVESMCSHQPQALKVYLQDWDGSNATAEYDNFSITKVKENWALHVGGYDESSNAGDSLSSQNGAMFTYKPELGGWWHSEEDGGATPTGKYYTQNFVRLGREAGVEWPSWKGDKISLKTLVIMIRPKT